MAPASPLTDLFEEAFTRDWGAKGEAPGERLRTCLARRDSHARREILEEVEALLGRGLCDMQMAELIAFELGSHLSPQEMGLTPTEWLAWVGRQVAAT